MLWAFAIFAHTCHFGMHLSHIPPFCIYHWSTSWGRPLTDIRPQRTPAQTRTQEVVTLLQTHLEGWGRTTPQPRQELWVDFFQTGSVENQPQHWRLWRRGCSCPMYAQRLVRTFIARNINTGKFVNVELSARKTMHLCGRGCQSEKGRGPVCLRACPLGRVNLYCETWGSRALQSEKHAQL